eukprot:CAMPEP_0168731776 /NCGR_PEP_ID=MMETSP0724-20121128/7434_1 /TAXON_ID=265536 /ORGANISM="Amphiprora sp., Strain CCMP467" /LENGTH=546 /DNA_ID=CAMNT_0008778783 /DNA_START=455 /DNA_END=2095 /DNA_ORIENTATION=+
MAPRWPFDSKTEQPPSTLDGTIPQTRVPDDIQWLHVLEDPSSIHEDEDEDDKDDLPQGFSLELAKQAGFQNHGVVPETEEDLKKAEEVLSKELANLSMNEHEEAMFDVVGFRHAEEETDAFLTTQLAELDRQLQRISFSRKRDYDAACKLNPDYVQGRKFRLAFLRSNRFDPQKAAGTIVNHFHLKKRVFADYPNELQGREVKFTDLSPDAREIVEAGYLQVSPSNDAAGRAVLFYATFLKRYKTVESLKQAIWYFMSCRSRNENVQRSGEVIVVYSGGVPDKLETAFFMTQVKTAFASDIQALHLCGTTTSMRFFLAAKKLYMDNFTRIRMQEHRGTCDEINFALQTFGINTDDSPLKPDNTLDTALHKKWLEAQKQYEENTSGDTILFLHRFDVLFGKNKRCTHHPGTMRCQLLVEIHWEEYERQNRLERGQTAANIVGIVHESHGRFLKWDGDNTTGGWKEVDDDTARKKVTHYFRGIRERKQKGQNQTNISAPKRGIDSENQTYTSGSITRASSSTKVSDASLFAKRIRAPGLDNISESLET